MRKVLSTLALAAAIVGAGGGIAQSHPVLPGPPMKGLCNAYHSGSDNGMAHKRAKSDTFVYMKNRANELSYDNVTQWCYGGAEIGNGGAE